MSKYDALWRYVVRQPGAEVTMSFSEIENAAGFPIDHAFLTYKKELAEYGWEFVKLSQKQKWVQFRRMTGSEEKHDKRGRLYAKTDRISEGSLWGETSVRRSAGKLSPRRSHGGKRSGCHDGDRRSGARDLDAYRAAVDRMGNEVRPCGFLCGREEMAAWTALEICHVQHTTKDYLGCLRELSPAYARGDVVQYVKYGIGNLFHEICHRRIYTNRPNSEAKLPRAANSLFFLLQNMIYLEKGEFPVTGKALAEVLEGEDAQVFALFRGMADGQPFDYDEAYGKLFSWCQHALSRY